MDELPATGVQDVGTQRYLSTPWYLTFAQPAPASDGRSKTPPDAKSAVVTKGRSAQ